MVASGVRWTITLTPVLCACAVVEPKRSAMIRSKLASLNRRPAILNLLVAEEWRFLCLIGFLQANFRIPSKVHQTSFVLRHQSRSGLEDRSANPDRLPECP